MSDSDEERLFADAQNSCAYVSEVAAHLRVTSKSRPDVQVVLTFRNADGTMGEAALVPLEASMLVSEIADALSRDDRHTAYGISRLRTSGARP